MITGFRGKSSHFKNFCMFLGETATQPAVGMPLPRQTCKKMAEPRPGTTGAVLYSMTTAYWYSRSSRLKISLDTAGGAPVTHWLYCAEAGSSTQKSFAVA